jgi:hypothetical protein
MKIGVDQLKRFVDVAGVSHEGFEMIASAGSLTANVMNNDRNVVLVVEMQTEGGDESKFRMQRDILMKYLRNIDSKTVDMTSDDTLITFEGEDVKLFIPQVISSITDKTKKPLPKSIDWETQSTLSFTPTAVKKVLAVADNIGELVITFIASGGKVTAKIKRTAIVKNVAEVSNGDADFTVSYHLGALKDAFQGASDKPVFLTIYAETEQGRPPSSFNYSSGDLLISGLIAEWKEKE